MDSSEWKILHTYILDRLSGQRQGDLDSQLTGFKSDLVELSKMHQLQSSSPRTQLSCQKVQKVASLSRNSQQKTNSTSHIARAPSIYELSVMVVSLDDQRDLYSFNSAKNMPIEGRKQ